MLKISFLCMLASAVYLNAIEVPVDEDLLSVTYGNGLFVAVGDSGIIVTSPDCSTWIPRTSGTLQKLNSVAFGVQRFVAVGDSGVILASGNGMDWVLKTAMPCSTLNAVIYGGTQFVAAGSNGTLLFSPDGEAWESESLGVTNDFAQIAYGNGRYIVGGYMCCSVTDYYDVAVSNNTEVWTHYRLPYARSTSGSTEISSIIFGSNLFVGVGYHASRWGCAGFVVTSIDGTVWDDSVFFPEDSLGSPIGMRAFTAVSYGGGTYVAVGVPGLVCSSKDGRNWIRRDTISENGYTLWEPVYLSVTYGNGVFVAVGKQGVITLLGDGLDWTALGNEERRLGAGQLARDLKLSNYPNPFNPSTLISFKTQHRLPGVISIYSSAGRLVTTQSVSGRGTFTWDATGYPSGVYVCRLTAGGQSLSRRMILAR